MEITIGERIKGLRLSSGMTSQQLADLVGCSRKTIQRYENNSYEPTTYILKRLAAVFDVSAEYLLGQGSMESLSYADVYHLFELYKKLYHNEPLFDEPYYWISLRISKEGQYLANCFTQWIGYTQDTPPKEIRGPRRFSGEQTTEIIHFCTETRERPIILNRISELGPFFVFGGQAIARASLCEEHLPEIITPQIVPSPSSI